MQRYSTVKGVAVAALFMCGMIESQAAGKPVKVFIMAGQSNMEGHARVETFDYIGDDPATAPLLKQMRNAGYHYLGCAKIFALMGRAFADTLLNAQK